MKLLSITFLLLAVAMSTAFGSSQLPTLLIGEVQLGSAVSASEEFVEIVNTTGKSQTLDNVHLEYLSATGSTWSVKATMEGKIGPYSRLLISNYLDDTNFNFSGGLSGVGGHLRISRDQLEIDKVGWGNAISAEENPVQAHSYGESIKRRIDEDGFFIDTDNNEHDWFISTTPTPFGNQLQIELDPPSQPRNESLLPPQLPAPVAPENPTGENDTFPLRLSEIMPDPLSPLRDSEDEYVEIYNPNSFGVNLADYRLESGTDWRYGYTFTNVKIPAHSYLAIFAIDSNLTLSNSGSAVRILGPDESVLDEQSYEKHKGGWSWSLIDSAWVWAAPSPNQANKQATSELSSVSTNNETQNENLAEREVEFPDPSIEQQENGSVLGAGYEENSEESKLNSQILAGFVLLAVLYALYEYRDEIRIRIEQYRRYRAARQKDRSKPERWGSFGIAERYRRWQDNLYTWARRRSRQ